MSEANFHHLSLAINWIRPILIKILYRTKKTWNLNKVSQCEPAAINIGLNELFNQLNIRISVLEFVYHNTGDFSLKYYLNPKNKILGEYWKAIADFKKLYWLIEENFFIIVAFIIHKDVQIYINNCKKLLKKCAGDQDSCSFNGPGSTSYQDSHLNN